ncbi:histidine phosphotransferase family protein [Jannaschia aquimarina]|uniref:Histidine phosphotransferase ChpT C-terminal domain-containing protein n=1 Tax=Jannaschia aquimarina TaxID=935700 RepID=A0A0D1EJN8_9RHOB|nr:histidine phosphotransferase family protein [Jannaschia aquimarina]KIT17789.1 hypothetical protein jaqu_04480 [Jannaschia aquimarina]SNT14272.1 histidine phosphotransferase ChpT [Jannaschia aquimarina]
MTSQQKIGAAQAEDEPDLTTLLGSRLCHDLVSPVGAVGNGLELLEMMHGPSEELALVRASVDAALARIRFFRFAFGAAPDGQAVPAREMVQVVQAMYRDTKMDVIWTDIDDRPRKEIRIACLALCCVEVAVPWGGKVELSRVAQSWVIHVQAERLKIDSILWEALGKKSMPSDLKGSEVQFGLLLRETLRLKRPVSVTADDRHLSLVV